MPYLETRLAGSHAPRSRLTVVMDRTRLPDDIQALNAQLKADPALTEHVGPVHILTVVGRNSGTPHVLRQSRRSCMTVTVGWWRDGRMPIGSKTFGRVAGRC
jgi:hypothetical protein